MNVVVSVPNQYLTAVVKRLRGNLKLNPDKEVEMLTGMEWVFSPMLDGVHLSLMDTATSLGVLLNWDY